MSEVSLSARRLSPAAKAGLGVFARYATIIGLGLMTAGIYFALSYPASIGANWLERKLSYDRR